ncbi:MAG: carboxypeptidase regulatory-like domain-containing protein, partial [Phycisphaerae bacterium]
DTSGGDQPDVAEFVTLFEGERTVSLLELRNGRTNILAEAVVTTGRYTQIQLVVTMGSITLAEPDNRRFDLAVSDEGRGQIALHLAFEVLTSGQTVLLLDFDLGKSFKPLPEGDLDEPGMIEGFEFTPWLRLSDLGNSAALAGTVTDYQFNPLGDVAVTVFQDGDEVSTTFTDSDGGYQVLGLPGGSYRLEFSLHGFEDGEWADVFVEPGQTQEGVDIALTPDDDSQAD